MLPFYLQFENFLKTLHLTQEEHFCVCLSCYVTWTLSVVQLASVSVTSRTVRRCCPSGSDLDLWYNCQPSQAEDRFTEVLASYQDDEADLLSSVYTSSSCPLNQRREFEVINIPQDQGDEDYVEDLIYVILNDSLVEMDEKSVEESVMKTKYLCLTLGEEASVLVSVVCLEADPHQELAKCCPSDKSLSADLQCVDLPPLAPPPRAVLSPDTLRPSATFSLQTFPPSQDWCKAGMVVVDLVKTVITDGRFVSLNTGSVESFTCLDSLNSSLVALLCLDTSCQDPLADCVSKCCPPHQFLDINNSCINLTEDSDEAQLWRHPEPGVSYQHNFMRVFRYMSPGYIRPDCLSVVAMEENDTYRVLTNNTLHHTDYGLTNHYCVDNVRDSTGSMTEMVMKCVSDGTDVIRNVTFLTEEIPNCLESHVSTLRLVNTISGIISCIFLVVTFLVYVRVPELNNIHGKIVVSNVVSIFFLTAYLVLVYNGSHIMNPVLCKISGQKRK